jgi:hypothetical protein
VLVVLLGVAVTVAGRMGEKPPASRVNATINAPVHDPNIKKGFLCFPLLLVDIVTQDSDYYLRN